MKRSIEAVVNPPNRSRTGSVALGLNSGMNCCCD
jgi:hypothetical protein